MSFPELVGSHEELRDTRVGSFGLLKYRQHLVGGVIRVERGIFGTARCLAHEDLVALAFQEVDLVRRSDYPDQVLVAVDARHVEPERFEMAHRRKVAHLHFDEGLVGGEDRCRKDQKNCDKKNDFFHGHTPMQRNI